MDPNTRILMASSGSSGPPEPLTEPLLFPISADSSNTAYVHGIKTDGTVIGTYQLQSTGIYHAFFYNPFLVLQRYGSTTLYVIDCNDMSLYGTISSASPCGMAPWSDGKYVFVDGVSNDFNIADIVNLTMDTYAYDTDDGYNSRATDHMTVGFANNGSGLFTSLQDRYWWSIGTSASPSSYPVYYYYADKTSATSLGTKTAGYGPGNNYSRTWGLTFNQSNAMFCNIGSNFFRVSSTATSATSISPGSLSYDGNSYGVYFDSTDGQVRCTTSAGGFYAQVTRSFSTYDYRYRLAYYPTFASGGTTPTDCGIDFRNKTTGSTGYYYEPQNGTFMCQINDSGYVAVAYFDVAGSGVGTNTINIKILNGSTSVANYTTTISASYTSGQENSPPSTINGCSWTTNLLYSGTSYS